MGSSFLPDLQHTKAIETELEEVRKALAEKDEHVNKLITELERTKHAHRTEIDRFCSRCNRSNVNNPSSNRSISNDFNARAHNPPDGTESRKTIDSLHTRWNNAALLFDDQAGSLADNINLLRIVPGTNPPLSDEHSLSNEIMSPLSSNQLDTSDYTTTTTATTTTTTNSSASSPLVDLIETSNEAAGDNVRFVFHADQLLRERSELMLRLEAIRTHLIQVRSEWDGCLRASEHHINQLNHTLSDTLSQTVELRRNYENKLEQLRLQNTVLQTELGKYEPRGLKKANLMIVKDVDQLDSVNASEKCVLFSVANQHIAEDCSTNTELIQKLHEKLFQQDRLIKLQQKRMKEMRKVMLDQNKFKYHSSDRDSIDGFVNGEGYASRSNSLDRSSITSSQSCNKRIPNSTAILMSTEKYVSQPNDESENPDMNNCNNQSTSSINYRYLRHVLLKFLLSRESEARHLVRVLSALLFLTDDEEKLLNRTLTARRSWFHHRPRLSPSRSHGQFAQIIPPSP